MIKELWYKIFCKHDWELIMDAGLTQYFKCELCRKNKVEGYDPFL